MSVVAAIDVGTNSIHMVVATMSSRGALRVLARSREMVRLGSAAGDMKRLSPEAMERGVAAIQRFVIEARRHKATVRAIATSAVREALNKDVFVEKVLKLTGVQIEVVSGIEEGRLIYLGAMHGLPLMDCLSSIIDIGGGSTETIIGDRGQPSYIHSEKIGCIRLTRRFFPSPCIKSEQVSAARRAVRGEWAPILQKLSEYKNSIYVGTSGTMLSLFTIDLLRRGKRIPETLNGIKIKGDEILSTISLIFSAETPSDRAAIPGLDAKRVDIVTAGAIILEQYIHYLNVPDITVSTYSLREGIVYDTLQKQYDIEHYHHLSKLRYRSVENLCELYKVNREHALHVKELAVYLFDQLQYTHQLGDREREYLEAAALLHDVGYHISSDQHHKHGGYIVSNAVMPGFTNDETAIIAAVIRYHRKSHPKNKHSEYSVLSDGDKYIVKVLASMLRIAEGLDRRQQQQVVSVRVIPRKDSIQVTLVANGVVPDIELWGAERRKALLESVVQLPVRFGVDLER